jgi:hypothetical protein
VGDDVQQLGAMETSCVWSCRGYVSRVPNQDDLVESHRDQHGPALQQDGGRIFPKDKVLLR